MADLLPQGNIAAETNIIPTLLTRRIINTVCDALIQTPGIDVYACKVSTNNRRELIRDQLIGSKMVQKRSDIQRLIEYILSREACSFIKDDVNIGLRVAEAMSTNLARLSMDAFKDVGRNTAETALEDVVAQIKSVVNCVQDRNDQKVTVHFDPSYAPEGNFTLREVIDMRALFVRTYFHDLIKPGGDIVGVMDNFDGDGVSDEINNKRNEARRQLHAPRIEPGIWNLMNARINAASSRKSKKVSSNSIYTLRLHLDKQLMYARGVSMQHLVKILTEHAGDKANDISIVASSFDDAIIDVMHGNIELGANTEKGLAENMFLGVVAESLKVLMVAGIDKIKAMHPVRVDIQSMITKYELANEYRVAELGREAWINNNNLELTWDQVEYSMWLTKRTIKSDILLGEVGELSCVSIADKYINENIIINRGLRRPTEAQLTKLFIEQFSYLIVEEDSEQYEEQVPMKQLWVLTLDVIAMKIKAVDLKLIERILDYCGLNVVNTVKHQSLSLIGYIYVSSVANPKTVMASYFSNYSFDDVFTILPDNTVVIRPDASIPQAMAEYILSNPKAIIGNYFASRLYADIFTEVNSGTTVRRDVPIPQIVLEIIDTHVKEYANNPKVTMILQNAIIPREMTKNIFDLIKKDTISVTIYDYDRNFRVDTKGKLRRRKDAWLSEAATTRLLTKATTEAEMRFMLKNKLDLDRLTKYMYAIMDVNRKGKTVKTLIHEHILSHAYSQIIAFPFVDRSKTIANDWYNVVQVFGVQVMENNYVIELYQLIDGCSGGSKIDPRNLRTYAQYVAESGYPAGANLYGQIKHKLPFMSLAAVEKSDTQLINSFNRDPQSASDPAVSTFLGTVLPRQDNILMQIQQNDRMQKTIQLRTEIRYGVKKKVTLGTKVEAANKDAIGLAIKAILLDTDPYYSIPTIEVDVGDGTLFPYPPNIIITNVYSAPSILALINKDLQLNVIKLQNLKPYEAIQTKRSALPAGTNFVDINELFKFISDHKETFVRWKPE
jgi:hypothetical protein